jgi:hypothetical protein
MAHSAVVLLGADSSEHKLLDISHLLEMLPPNVRPHLLARQYRSSANRIKINEDELPDRQAELL